jgi:hypothetical protein
MLKAEKKLDRENNNALPLQASKLSPGSISTNFAASFAAGYS